MADDSIATIRPPEGINWHLHSPYGAQRFKDGPDGRLVRLADVVRWLMQASEVSFANAVRAVCAPLEGEAPPLVYRLDPMEDAVAEDRPGTWFKFLTGDEGLNSLPPQVAHARAAARDMRATWLMKPRELARLVNAPGYPAEYDETKESPFEFSERTDRTGGPKTLAVPFSVANELWGWGTVANEAPASPFLLADWPALVAYRKANLGSDWGAGNQIAVGKTELERRTEGRKATESDALEAMAKELGISRQSLTKTLRGERKRVKKAEDAAAPSSTLVCDGKVKRKAA